VLGVGIIGAGPVAQAIHVPTIATMPDRLRVVHVMDVEPVVAESVAARAGARAATDVETLLADPAVEIVAVCSPHDFHAEQVEAACAAGKKAILCEKPLATDRASVERIVAASNTSGVHVQVGAMHAYDPGYRAAAAAWEDEPVLVRSMIALPPNDRFVAMATELLPASTVPHSSGGHETMMTGLILGLATHAVPLVRDFAPAIDELAVARVVDPVGYELTLRSGDTVVQYLSQFHDHWHPDWHVEAWGPRQHLRVDFPPSFVLAGSGAATVNGQMWPVGPENAYQAEWRHLAAVAEGGKPAVPVERAAQDMLYALELLDGALAKLGAA
jgi:myo-inositol 2-dehydrogenase/D-chiro-inositol 1-dehydrogenase